jgi:hypothetical protein
LKAIDALPVLQVLRQQAVRTTPMNHKKAMPAKGTRFNASTTVSDLSPVAILKAGFYPLFFD